jgi:hypothetical protein
LHTALTITSNIGKQLIHVFVSPALIFVSYGGYQSTCCFWSDYSRFQIKRSKTKLLINLCTMNILSFLSKPRPHH